MGVCGGFVQTLGDPGIEAFARSPCGDINPAVQVRGEAQHELAGKRLFRGLAKLGAKIQVIVHRVMERLPDLIDRGSLKGDDVTGVDDIAVENTGLVVNSTLPAYPLYSIMVLALLLR